MHVLLLKENLAKALLTASRFVNTKAQLPILGNILLQARKQKLGIIATNLEVSFFTTIGAKVEEEGEITVPARTLTDLVGNLGGGTVNLRVQKEQLEIASERFTGRIAALNANDFPKIPQGVGEKSIQIPVEDLVAALTKVLFAASVDETRPILTGVLFWFAKRELTLAASDGFRLSRKTIPLKESVPEQKIVLPKFGVQELVRILSEKKGVAKLSVGTKEKQVVLASDDLVFSSRLLEGEFPDFEKIIPTKSEITVETDRQELLRAVKTAAIFARESANIVKLIVGREGVVVEAESQKSGNQKTQVEAKVEGGGVEITYNYKFIEDFLNCVAGESVTIGLTDISSPGVFADPEDPNFLHLIMPVKVQG